MGRVMSVGVGLAAAALLTSLTVVPAAAEPEPVILFPEDGATVDQGEITIRGRVSADGTENAAVVYAVDVSGSTSARGYDCNGDGSTDAADDFNSDGQDGETLDCEIAGVIALNTSLAAITGSVDSIRVGLVPFGSRAAVADVGGQPGQQDFVAPTDDEDDNDRDRTADIVQVAGSLDQGRATLFAPLSVGGGTNFTNALNTAFDVLEDQDARRVVFLLTDGSGSLSSATLDRMDALGVEVRPFAIGAGSDRCRAGGALDRIGDRSGFPCVYAASPTGLNAALTGQPPSIAGVDVQIDDGSIVAAEVDALGNFSADAVVERGAHTATVTVRYTNGATETSTSRFTAVGGSGFVALGDSYSAGEGITPFVDLPGPEQGCHQSTKGYATFVGTPGYELPNGQEAVLDYVACSGAVLRNILAVPQNARGETHIVQLDRVSAADDLIAFTVGGNDVAFSEVVKHCATQLDCENDGFATLTSGRSLTLDDFLSIRLRLFEPELGAFYRTIRDRTDNNPMIVAMNYPELFDDGNLLRLGCFEGDLFSKGEREYLNEKAIDLRDVISRQAAAEGIHFADVVEPFKGHRVCEGGINTQSEWLVGIEVSKKIAGDASFHPDDTGAEAYARILTSYIRDTADAGGPVGPAGLPRNPEPTNPVQSAAARLDTSIGADATASAQVSMATAATAVETLSTKSLTPEDLTPEELAEVTALEFGPLEIEGLAFRRGEESCLDRAALGEQLIVSGHGFAPGAEVDVSVKAHSEGESRALGRLTADEIGFVEASLAVPHDLQPSAEFVGEQPWTGMRIDVEGPSLDGGTRRLNDVIAIDPPSGTCTALLDAAGDITGEDGSPAASAGRSGAPATLLSVAATGPRVDVTPPTRPTR